ncbi:MAG: hypothetical protein KME22_19055 [Hassallia sp. WJT32-NPBG1]|nr:hypothetical protein [Hassallia sp. WJT32-NPBG1]
MQCDRFPIQCDCHPIQCDGVINGQPYIVALNNAEIKARNSNAAVNLAVKIDVLDRLFRGN